MKLKTSSLQSLAIHVWSPSFQRNIKRKDFIAVRSKRDWVTIQSAAEMGCYFSFIAKLRCTDNQKLLIAHWTYP